LQKLFVAHEEKIKAGTEDAVKRGLVQQQMFRASTLVEYASLSQLDRLLGLIKSGTPLQITRFVYHKLFAEERWSCAVPS
jgi:hypothetical protein